MRQYRFPEYKPELKKMQANLEKKLDGHKTKRRQSNAHIDILDVVE